jgi:hypothetical protein
VDAKKEMLERLVKIHGEQHRTMIAHALEWLDRNEAKWDIKIALDRELFVAELIKVRKK